MDDAVQKRFSDSTFRIISSVCTVQSVKYSFSFVIEIQIAVNIFKLFQQRAGKFFSVPENGVVCSLKYSRFDRVRALIRK